MIHILLSFILASTWVSLSTIIAERLGTKAGGVVSTLPSTLIIAFLFMGLAQGPDFVSQASVVVPLGMGINAVFLAAFITFSNRGLGAALVGSLGIWFAMSTMVFYFPPGEMLISLAIFVLLVASAMMWLRMKHRFRSQSGKKIHYTTREVAFRGFFAGGIIAAAVTVASIGGPVLGAIFSVFPAIFTSTMMILHIRQGRKFTGAVGTTMILGSANVT
ncbi:MAG: DUF3147 family protein, partial [Candidatus Thermoplasmatota archaeon]|nr:DUF3147 family protein [Candidatus Thermoplasmatota archaeon]